MEELQSTDILAHEILEDARKRAQKILKTAAAMAQSKSTEWEQKTAETLDELRTRYAERERIAAHEVMTFLPIDKRRAKTRKIEELLNAAVENWYSSLSRERVLALLEHELVRRLAFCDGFTNAGTAYRVKIHRLDSVEAKAILQEALSGKPCIIEETYSPSAYPVLILETGDERIHASIDGTMDYFLSRRRVELTEALVGKAALEEDLC